MSEWIEAKGEKIAGKPCVKHIANHTDLQLFGNYGVLYQTGSEKYRALIDNHRVYNRLVMELGLDTTLPAIKGEERIVDCSSDSVTKVVKAIKVPRSIVGQISLSKRFSDPN